MNRRRRKIDVRRDGGDIDAVAGFLPSASGLRPYHRPYLLSPPRPPVAAADLRLAAIRRLAGISGAAEIPRFLAGEPRRAVALGDGRAFPADPAGRDPRHRRRVPAALRARRVGKIAPL